MHINKSHLAYSVMVGLAVAHDLRTQFRAYKAAKCYLAAVETYEETERILQTKLEFLCQKLDENDITITEFDLIMLNNDLTK